MLPLRWLLGLAVAASALAATPLITPEQRLEPGAPAWRDLAERFGRRPDVVADFEETRVFPFRVEPVVLRGEVRVSRWHGLSLHYTSPQERTIILDGQGMLLRDPGGKSAPPPDPRANLANEAFRHILRLDLGELAKGYEIYGRIEGDAWSLALVPRDAGTRRAIGDIYVEGTGEAVRRIELRRSAKQHIDIAIAPARPAAAFSAEELRRFFR